ncbi:hypothetical protein FJ938_27945 [Mesorhizobium sp. B2-4-14]|uniref:beta strand repeat-containing protein n=1 Tax=Mesorhizobium sp. B2-4-14 TaxID=2589935 RepID=UPI001125F18A|nr:Ig-like domain-containing protein [Mesorhizobium sp. B2-4-14]TPK95517.1 hypothetical protein FJ938_27945 [Mesorhizobium sp. B2-4-14]
MASSTYTWIDGTSGDWGSAADWSPTGVPDATSDASFTGSGSEAATVSSDEAVNQLTLDNAGTTLVVQDDATLSVYGGLVATAGSLNLMGNSAQATVDVFAPAGFGTPGVLTGNISLGTYAQPSDALIEFSSGQITDIAQYGSLLLFGPNARVADAGSLSGNSALQGLSTIEGTFELNGGGTLQTTGSLTNSGVFVANGDYFNDGSSSTVTIGGTVTNSGGFSISDGTIVSASGFNNTGNLQVASSFGEQAKLDITGPAGFGTAGVLTGHVQLEGNAVVQFASGQITDIASDALLEVGGPNAFVQDASSPGSNSALQGLSTIEGTLSLWQGATVQTIGDLANNNGTLILEDANLAIGGTFTNSWQVTDGGQIPGGTISATGLNNESSGAISVTGSLGLVAALDISGAATNDGTLTAQFATVNLQGPVSGSGSAVIGYGATIEFGSSVASTERIVFDNFGSFDYTLKIDQADQFSGIISGFGSSDLGNDVIELGSGQAASATPISYSNGVTTLQVDDAASNVVASLRLLGDYTGYTFNVASDGGITTNAAAPPPPADDLPALTVPGAQTVTVGNALELFGSGKAVNVGDPDADILGETFTVQISHAASNGTGFTILPEGATVTGSGTDSVSITGTLAQVNAALATLDYASNNPGVQPGTDTITFQVTDSDGGTDTKTVAVNVVSPTPLTTFSFLNNGTDNGIGPNGGLIADANGDLFGTTVAGGTSGYGTVFELVNNGTAAVPNYASTPTTLVSFDLFNGGYPYGGLIVDANGDLFGTTSSGNASIGTVFEIVNNGTAAAPSYAGTPTTLASFHGSNGASPYGNLFADAGGNLFGTTTGGGVNGYGTVFEISGAFTATSDQDAGEQAALGLTVNANAATPIGSAGARAVTFTVAGLDPEDSGTVTFKDSNSKTVTVDVTGGQTNYMANLTGLADGTITSSLAVATDPAGNSFIPVNGNAVSLDQTAPQVTEGLASDTGVSSTDKITSNDTLSGSGDPNALVSFTVDGTAIQQTATANAGGNWTFSPASLADGSHTLVASETDAAGNTGTASLTFTLDATAPALDYHYLLINPNTGHSTGGGVTLNVNAFTLAGYLVDSAPSTQVEVFATKSGTGTATSVGSGTVDAGGNFSIPTAALPDGTYTFSVTATDLAGNATTEVGPYGLTIDTVAPPVTEALVNDTGISSTDKITSSGTLGGSGDPNAVVHFTVDGTPTAQMAAANASGAWTFTPTGLADGSHTIVASETDAAGNTGTASLTFTLDTTAPQVNVSLDHSTINLAANTAVVTFEFSEAVTGFGLGSVSATGGSLSNLQTRDGGKTYTATFTATNGIDISNASVIVSAGGYQDPAGNVGSAASTGSIAVDTVNPTVSVTTSNGDVNVANGTATITFSFSEAPTEFSLAHVNASGGTLSNLQQVNATTYTALFTGSAGTDIGTASVAVDNNWHENNGNAGTGGATTPFVVDTVSPTVAVSINNSNLTLSQRTATVTFSFGEAPVSFTLADTTAVGGALSSFQKVNATSYTATFTAAANTLISNASVAVVAHSWQEGNGNPGAGGATGNFNVDTLDHWANASGGSWSTASNWGNGVPAAGVAADIDRSGTYTVAISGASSAYGLLVNDGGATVSDNKNGALTLAGTGGSNGVLTISAGTFALAGGSLAAGAISIASGGVLQISQTYLALAEAIANNGAITLASATSKGITASFNGTLTGAGTMTVQSGATAVIGTAVSGSGSFTLTNNGNLEFVSADSENVTFASGATGTLKLDHSLTAPFTGKISGLSPNNAVDLADLKFTKKNMTAIYTGNTTGGLLTVSNGSQSVTLNLLGDYTHSAWTLSKDSGSGTLVVDPSTAQAPPLVASATESHSPDIALLVNYMASAFPVSGNGHGSSLVGDPSLAAINQHSLLAQPHHA